MVISKYGDKSTPPLVSIIIPVFKGEKYVSDAIESALGQTYERKEIIAINDGCPGYSLEILNKFKSQITIINQQNGGVAKARNAGLIKAKGEFFSFLDQDDFWCRDKLQKQVKIFQENPNIGLVHTAVRHIDACTGKAIPPLNPASQPGQLIGRCRQRLLTNNAIYNSSVMVSRTALNSVGICDESITGNTIADYDLWLRISSEFEFGFVDKELTTYRTHSSQGLLDRRAMLNAEISLLSNTPVQLGWKSKRERNKKISSLYDELAVFHADSGNWKTARLYFRTAATQNPSFRTTSRLLGSYIPKILLQRIRKTSVRPKR